MILRKARFYKRRSGAFFRIIVILVIAVAALVTADVILRPQIRSLAAVKAGELAESSVNNAVLSALNGSDYGTLVTVEKNEEGQVTAVQTDVLKINMMKARISESTGAVLTGTTNTVRIPIGSLTGLDILSGRGPALKVRVSLSGFSQSQVRSTFTGEGINQTVHRLMLTVNTNVYMSLPGSRETKSLTYEVCIAETVIVGYVPEFYANTDRE